MPADFKRRIRGTPRQLGTLYPIFKNGQIPEETKQRKRACASQWNRDNPERFAKNKRLWYLKKKLERELHGKH